MPYDHHITLYGQSGWMKAEGGEEEGGRGVELMVIVIMYLLSRSLSRSLSLSLSRSRSRSMVFVY